MYDNYINDNLSRNYRKFFESEDPLIYEDDVDDEEKEKLEKLKEEELKKKQILLTKNP